jgi:hypothetical protein
LAIIFFSLCWERASCILYFYIVFGGDGEEETPVPIPNTEVKLFSADGTARGTAWESRTPPRSFKAKSLLDFPRGFLFHPHLFSPPLVGGIRGGGRVFLEGRIDEDAHLK